MKATTRRGFLSGTVGVIASSATTATTLQLPAEHTLEGLDKSHSLRKTASALHDVIGRYSDQNASFHFPASSGKSAIMFAMECLRTCSVDEIQHVLRPLYQKAGGAK